MAASEIKYGYQGKKIFPVNPLAPVLGIGYKKLI